MQAIVFIVFLSRKPELLRMRSVLSRLRTLAVSIASGE